MKPLTEPYHGMEVAVIGMAGKFPMADNIQEFWANLTGKRDCMSYVSKQELDAIPDSALQGAGLNRQMIADPRFVGTKGGILKDLEFFDADFFDYTPGEAILMDPQIRLMHECVWEALEDAGCNPYTYPYDIGLFAGASKNYLWNFITEISGKVGDAGRVAASHLNNKDFLCTRISYKLNLRGPSMLVDSACSTSLSAVHLACRALLTGECKIAIAGGVSVYPLPRYGYLYEEGNILSKDGSCRAFDENASGTCIGDGVGAVVLKRLSEAIKDNDHIYCIVKGSAVNNDGSNKIGYTAPGMMGHVSVIRKALQAARVDPSTIGYVEAHGTGTSLGDLVEIEVLKKAYAVPGRTYNCYIGTVKTNIGHTNAAAGICGFIKTALCLKNRQIPPVVHFTNPHPKLALQNAPFIINTTVKPWNKHNGIFRAAVSSLGIGGTNVHVIMEEYAGTAKLQESRRPWYIIPFSAKNESSLQKNIAAFTTCMDQGRITSLEDAAYSLQTARHAFSLRSAFVCREPQDAIQKLTTGDSVCRASENRKVYFLFPGQGMQQLNMARRLYEVEPGFRKRIDQYINIVKPIVAFDVEKLLLRVNEQEKTEFENIISQTEVIQPLLFIVELALAELLMDYGIKPDALLGYSLGEYVAATLAGVFKREEALHMIVKRGQLIQCLPGGSMLSVMLPEQEVKKISNGRIDVAGVITGSNCVVGGTEMDIQEFGNKLEEQGIAYRKVNISHAFHSSMMYPVADSFRATLNNISFNDPVIPFFSNLTGTYANAGDCKTPQYWIDHLCSTVRFNDSVSELLKTGECILIEVGPGSSLRSIVAANSHFSAKHHIINVMGRDEGKDDAEIFYGGLADIWMLGKNINWEQLYTEKPGNRISLPPYQFSREKYAIETNGLNLLSHKMPGSVKSSTDSNGCYIPTWSTTKLPTGEGEVGKRCLVIIPPGIFEADDIITEAWRSRVPDCIIARQGAQYQQADNLSYVVNFRSETDPGRLFRQLSDNGFRPDKIICFYGPKVDNSAGSLEKIKAFEAAQPDCLYVCLQVIKEIKKYYVYPVELIVVTESLNNVTGEERIREELSPVMGLINVVPQELPFIQMRNIDLLIKNSAQEERKKVFGQLISECLGKLSGKMIAYRNGERWERSFTRATMEKNVPLLKEKGTYLLTGGMGKIGLSLAAYLCSKYRANVVLVGRTPVPPQHEWESILMGGAVLTCQADVGRHEEMQGVLAATKERFGKIDGVFHAAGALKNREHVMPVERITPEFFRSQFLAKVQGLYILEDLFADQRPDFIVAFSSLSSIIGGWGFAAYAAANAFMDAFVTARRNKAINWIVVNWDGWHFKNSSKQQPGQINDNTRNYLEEQEGIAALEDLITDNRYHQVIISKTSLEDRIKKWLTKPEEEPVAPGADLLAEDEAQTLNRPRSSAEYIRWRTATENRITKIWQKVLGYKIGIQDNFFEAGGDSLKAVTIIGRITREFGVSIDLAAFLSDPTVTGIAAEIDNRSGTGRKKSIPPACKKEYYELSLNQQRIYAAQRIFPQSIAYNIPVAFIVRNMPDIKKIEKVFEALIARHDSFRTSFREVNGSIVQVIHDKAELVVKYAETDLEDYNDIIKQYVTPFDLEKAPLLKVFVVKTGPNEHLLITDFHHLIFDGISQQLFFEDFIQVYNNTSLPAVPFQYKDFSEFQHHITRTVEIGRQKEYWLKKFSGNIPELNMPFDFLRANKREFKGNILSHQLDSLTSMKIRDYTREANVTYHMFMLAVTSVLMHKYTGQEDIIIGTDIAGRRVAEFEKIIGFFVGQVALRSCPVGKKRFKQFLQEVREDAIGAIENQDYQFNQLIKELGLSGKFERNPLFDVFVVVKGMRLESETAGTPLFNDSTEITPVENFFHIPSIRDLQFNVLEKQDGIRISLIYNTELFMEDTCQRMLQRFTEIIQQVIQHDTIAIEDIVLQSDFITVDPARVNETAPDFLF